MFSGMKLLFRPNEKYSYNNSSQIFEYKQSNNERINISKEDDKKISQLFPKEEKAHTEWIRSIVVLSKKPRYLFSACEGGKLIVWDLKEQKKINEFDLTYSIQTMIELKHPTNTKRFKNCVMTCSSNGTLSIYNIEKKTRGDFV